LVTANQNPFPVNSPYTVSGSFASPYRSTQIYDMLMAKQKLTPADTLAIEKDVYSAFEDHLARALVGAWDALGESGGKFGDLKPAIDRLRRFNGQIDKDSSAALIVVLSDHYFRSAMGDSASPGKGSEYSFQMAYAAADKLLQQRPGGWFADYNTTLLECLHDAVREAQRTQGRNMDRWRYGSYLRIEVDHPVGHLLPLVSHFFDLGPVPMSGGSTTVKQTTRRLYPSERMNVVVGDWNKSLLNIPIGESGHVLSRHYKDEWDAYYNGRSFPMQFGTGVEVKSRLAINPQ
jgi:penicillin amidase